MNANAESDQSTVLLSPVIVVTTQSDETGSKEALCLTETREEVQITTDAAAAEPTGPAPPNSPDADVTHEASAPEPPAEPAPTITLDLSPLVSPQTAEAQVQRESAVPDVPTSHQPSEEDSSIQPDSPSHPPDPDPLVKLSLGSLSEAITCTSLESPVMPVMGQQTTDRAVYLTGGVRDSWEVQRVKEDKRKEEAKAEINETNKAGREQEREEVTGEEAGEEQIEAQSGGEPVSDGCRCSGSPEQRESRERTEEGGTSAELQIENNKEDDDDDEAAGEKGDHTEEEVKPVESQLEGAAEPPVDSVACIRELVAEIFEVETTVTPCPDSSSSP